MKKAAIGDAVFTCRREDAWFQRTPLLIERQPLVDVVHDAVILIARERTRGAPVSCGGTGPVANEVGRGVVS